MRQRVPRFVELAVRVGAVGRMQLSDPMMSDVGAYNRSLVDSGYSQSQSKRLCFLKTLDRAGRPEHGSQVLEWNWDSRDKLPGEPAVKRKLPSLKQLKAVLKACDDRETAMVWMAIGCGFGQRDLAAMRVRQMDRKNYDLRRGKTGVDCYGDTLPLVWKTFSAYLKR